MITLIPPAFTGFAWETIDLGNGDTIEIGIRRPTLSEQLVALQDCGPSCEYKVRAYVADWRGVNNEKGEAIPFSWDAINQLCAVYPGAIWALLDSVRKVRFAEGADDSKNSESPPLAGGMTTIDEIIDTMTSSDSTAISVASNDSPTLSP